MTVSSCFFSDFVETSEISRSDSLVRAMKIEPSTSHLCRCQFPVLVENAVCAKGSVFSQVHVEALPGQRTAQGRAAYHYEDMVGWKVAVALNIE